MNCLEYRRAKLSDPGRVPPEARAHERECEQCLAFARGIDAAEASLEEALAVRVPEGLSERVLLRHYHPARRAWMTWTLAAGIALVVAVALHQFKAAPADAYARLAIEHVLMEPESLLTERNNDPGALRAALHSFGGTLKEPIGRIRYIKLCPVEDGSGWHIVLETPEGLATLILVPDKHVASATGLDASGFNARVQPAPRGYYAIITASPAGTVALDRLIRQHVEWST